jgi:hypothetical protein
MSMSAIVKETINRLLATICMMWLWDTREHQEGTWMVFYVYPTVMNFRDDRLPKEKRIRVEFKIEDSPSAS